MTPFSSSICQEVSSGSQSVFSSSSNLNSPAPQEQSGVIVGAEEEVGLKEGRDEVDGANDNVGTEDGGEEIVGGEDNVGSNEMDGTAEGTPRFGSHGMSILSRS